MIYVAPLQTVFHTAVLGAPELLFLLGVWGTDELRRMLERRRTASPVPGGR